MLKSREVRTYWNESRRFRDFLRVLQVRLSLSKIGPLVCPLPISAAVDLESLGQGVTLRSHTSDISVLGELLVGHSYEYFVAAVKAEPDLIIDLGANTGLAARWFLERFPTARVVSVEPEPGNIATLRDNLASYGDRATVIAAAIGGWSRRMALTTNGGEFAFSITEPKSPTDKGQVDVVTMDRVLANLHDSVDLLKVDIEGAEKELFSSCSSWLGRVQLASVECHHPFTHNDLLRILRANGAEVDVLRTETTPQFGCDSIIFRPQRRRL